MADGTTGDGLAAHRAAGRRADRGPGAARRRPARRRPAGADGGGLGGARRLRRRRACPHGRRGGVLLPWPNRLRDGRWRWQGADLQLEVPSPSLAERHPRPGVLAAVGRCSPATADAVTVGTVVEPHPGYPFRLAVAIDYALAPDRLSVTVRVRNAGTGPAPFGVGMHPYLRVGATEDGDVGRAELHAAGPHPLELDDGGLPTGGRQPFDGAIGRIGDRALDDAVTDLERDADGWARARLSGPAGALELAVDGSWSLAAGLHRRHPAGRGVAAQRRRRADDLPAERASPTASTSSCSSRGRTGRAPGRWRGRRRDPGSATLRVAELWRYPVKSLLGERLAAAADAGPEGLDGDRRWALFDLDTGLRAHRPAGARPAVRRRPAASRRRRGGGAARRHGHRRRRRPLRLARPPGGAAPRRPARRRAGLREPATTSRTRPPAGGTRSRARAAPSTTTPAPGCRCSRPARSAPGTAAASGPTCCSTAPARTSSTAGGCGSAGRCSPSAARSPAASWSPARSPAASAATPACSRPCTASTAAGWRRARWSLQPGTVRGGRRARRRTRAVSRRAHRRAAPRGGHHPARPAAQAGRRGAHRRAGEGRAARRCGPGQRRARGAARPPAAPRRRRRASRALGEVRIG